MSSLTVWWCDSRLPAGWLFWPELPQSQGEPAITWKLSLLQRSCVFWAGGSQWNLQQALHEALRKCLGVHCWLSGPSSPFRASFSRALKSSTRKVTFKWQVRTSRSFLGDCHSLRPGPATAPGLHVRGPRVWHRAPQLRPTRTANTAWRTPRLYLSAGSLTPKACLHY